MTYEQAQARKAAFEHLNNVDLVRAFLEAPAWSPPAPLNDAFVLCEMLADREALGENPGEEFEAACRA